MRNSRNSLLAIGLTGVLLGSAWATAQPPAGAPAKTTEGAAEGAQAGGASADEMERVMASLRKALKDDPIVRTLGFWNSRMAMMDRIAAELPALKEQTLAAKKAMIEKLGPGKAELEKLYLSRGEDRAAILKETRENSDQAAKEKKLDERELAKAIESGGLSPQGQLARYTQMLLVMDPKQQRKPELAFDDGFVFEIPLAEKGGEPFGRVVMPTTFGLISGEKPGDALTFAFAGYAPATITITVEKLDAPIDAEKAMDNMVAGKPAHTTFKREKGRVVETKYGKAGIIPMEVEIDTGKMKALGRGTMMVLPVGMRLIGIGATVQAGEGEGQGARADALLARFGPLFERVRGSLEMAEGKK